VLSDKERKMGGESAFKAMEDDHLLWYPTDECLHKDCAFQKLCYLVG